MAPLEDTIVALRPIIPQVPWEVPNAIHDLSPMMPTGATKGFQNIDPQGIPTAPIVNQLVNFGWEYVWHCHILSHEEMDMMRPQNLAMPPNKATGLAFTVPGGKVDLAFSDNSINETSFLVQRTADGVTWTDQGTIAAAAGPAQRPPDQELRRPGHVQPRPRVRLQGRGAQHRRLRQRSSRR